MGWLQDQKNKAKAAFDKTRSALDNFIGGATRPPAPTPPPAQTYGPARPAATPARTTRQQSLSTFGYTPTKPTPPATTPAASTYGPPAPAATKPTAPKAPTSTLADRSGVDLLSRFTGPLKTVDLPGKITEEIKRDVPATGRLIGGIATGLGSLAAEEGRRWAANDSPFAPVENALSTLGRIGREVIRAPARAGTSAVLSGLTGLESKLGVRNLPSEIPAPVSPVGRFFLGDTPIRNFASIGESGREGAQAFGYGDAATSFAPILAIGSVISDMIPGFGSLKGKPLREAVDVAVERAVKEATEAATERAARTAAGEAVDIAVNEIDDVVERVVKNLETVAKKKFSPAEQDLIRNTIETRMRQPSLNLPEGDVPTRRAVPNAPETPGAARRVATEAAEDVPTVRLPRNLAGAKPRYGFGPKQFVLDFVNDIDKAAYITAQPKRSIADSAYLKFVEDATGMTEQQIRAHGAVVRNTIKDLARVADDSVPLKVPSKFTPNPVPGKVPSKVPPLPNTPSIPVGTSKVINPATGYGDKNVVTSALGIPGKKKDVGFKAQSQARQLLKQGDEAASLSAGVPTPESLAPGMKDRGFVETVREATTTKPQVAEGVSGVYSPETNRAQLAEARKTIETDRDAALTRALSVTDNIEEATQSNVIAQELMREAQNAGNYDLAVELAQKAAERGTKLGQAIQVYSLWGRMTPEGALKYASKLLDEASRKAKFVMKMDPKAAERIIVQGKLVENVGKIMDEAGELVARGDFDNAFRKFAEVGRGAAKSDVSKILAGADKFGKDFMSLDEVASAARRQQLFEGAILARESASVVPASIGRKLATYQTMSLLLNVKTMLRNFLGNAGLAVAEAGSDVIGSLIDLPLSKITGNRTRALPNFRAQASGFARGMREGVAEARQGINLSGVAGAYDLGKQTGFTFKNPVLRAGERTLGVLMRGPDRAFYQQAYDGTIAELRRLTGSADITPEMQEIAHSVGLYRTFQDETKLAQALELMKRGMNKLGTGDFGLGDAIIKFPKTPANVLNRGLAYSPAGFARSVFELAKPLLTLGKGKFDQRAFVEATSRALVGTTGLVGTGYVLSQLGILTGRKAEDKDIQQLRRESGLGEYRLNTSALKRFFLSGFDATEARPQVGDTVISYDWFQPAALSLAIGANVAQNKGDSSSFAGAVASALGSAGNAKFLEALVESVSIVEDQPMLVGLKRLFQKGSVGEGVLDAITAMPATFIPTAVNQVRQAIDPYSREYVTSGDGAFGLGGVLKTGVNQVINRIPGASETLPKKYTVFGEEKLAYPAGNDIKSVFITPWYKDILYLTPESAMVLGIYDQTGETTQAPRVVDRSQEAYGSSFKLTNEQVSKMQQAVGTATKNIYNKLASNARFMALPDDEKADMLADVLSDIHTSVRVAPYIESLGLTYPTGLPFVTAKEMLDDLNKDDRFKNGTDEQKAQVLQNIFNQMK